MQLLRFTQSLQSIRLMSTTLALGAVLTYVAGAVAQELPEAPEQPQQQIEQQQEQINEQAPQQEVPQAQEQPETPQLPDAPEVDAQGQADVEAETEVEGQINPEGRTQTDIEGRTQTETDIEGQVNPEGRTQTDVEGRTQSETDVEGQVNPQGRTQTDVEGRTQTETDVQGQAQTQGQQQDPIGISVDAEADTEEGITIGNVAEGSAAAEAGIRRGDVILSIDGQEIGSEQQLQQILRSQAAGQPLDLTVRRNGQEERMSLTLPRMQLQGEAGVQSPVRLGVAFDEDARVQEGISIADVMQGSVAADAGIRRGDVILSFDGQPVTSASQFERLIQARAFGDTVPVVIMRDGQRQNLDVTFRQFQFNDRQQFAQDGQRQMGRHGWLGVTLERDSEQQGAEVATVFPAGPAARAGIRQGDAIVGLQGQRISSVDQLLSQLRQTSPGQRLDLLVMSSGRERNLTVTLEDSSVFNVSAQQQDSRYTWNDPDGFQTQITSHDMLLEQHRHLAEQHQRLENMLHQIQADLAAIRRELNISDDARQGEPGAAVEFREDTSRRDVTNPNQGPQFDQEQGNRPGQNRPQSNDRSPNPNP